LFYASSNLLIKHSLHARYYFARLANKTSLHFSAARINPIFIFGEGKTRGQAAILMVRATHNQNTAAIVINDKDTPEKYVYFFPDEFLL